VKTLSGKVAEQSISYMKKSKIQDGKCFFPPEIMA